MIKTNKVVKTVIENIYICDNCGATSKSGGSYHKCSMCGKLFCRNCMVVFDWAILKEGEFSGDYPDYMCKNCWENGKNYREKIIDIRAEADAKEEALIESWRSSSESMP